jgi:hypothetical protein
VFYNYLFIETVVGKPGQTYVTLNECFYCNYNFFYRTFVLLVRIRRHFINVRVLKSICLVPIIFVRFESKSPNIKFNENPSSGIQIFS